VGTVLIVDDDVAVGAVLAGLLEQAGIQARHVPSAERALGALASTDVDVVVSDVRMPGMDGLELLERVRERWVGVPVILLTAHGTVPLAVQAMRAGAADFILKPFDREEVLHCVRKALLRVRRDELEPPERAPAENLPWESPGLAEAADLVRRAARSSANVLIRGETGTGKGVLARAIHGLSARSGEPFVTVQCGALPENLLESELFGYEKGAFTGATGRKPGRVELAGAGTLFLDEIGDVPLPMQAKLLRLLQEREYEPLGGTAARRTEARFIAATHRDLDAMIRRGELREDLYYRLNVVVVHVAALRERRADVGVLAERFLRSFAAQNGRPDARFESAALDTLAEQSWPGNVRQLENFVERLVVLGDGNVIGAADVERELTRDARLAGRTSAPPDEVSGAGAAVDGEQREKLEARRREAERAAIQLALQRTGGNRTNAARLLGVSRRTLYNKLTELGIESL